MRGESLLAESRREPKRTKGQVDPARKTCVTFAKNQGRVFEKMGKSCSGSGIKESGSELDKENGGQKPLIKTWLGQEEERRLRRVPSVLGVRIYRVSRHSANSRKPVRPRSNRCWRLGGGVEV